VHAWATLFNYQMEMLTSGEGDVEFLKRAFQKLLLNFTWWVNRKDPTGKNVFEGGFLGLDNIGVFDRSAALPSGGHLEQADGTAWMALYSQNMLSIALTLAMHDPVYEDMANKFLEHFLWIAAAMDRVGENADEMWDEEDGFSMTCSRPDRSQRVASAFDGRPAAVVRHIRGAHLVKLTRFKQRWWFIKPTWAGCQYPPLSGWPSRSPSAGIADETKVRRAQPGA
jgi:hypothetical protein